MDGVFEFKLSDGESVDIDGLPIGMAYEVEETDSGGLRSEMSGNAQGAVGDEAAEIVCTNARSETPEPTPTPTPTPTPSTTSSERTTSSTAATSSSATHPMTGDETNLALAAGLAALGAAAVVLGVSRLRKCEA